MDRVRGGGPLPDRAFQLMVEAVHDYAILMLDPDGVVRTWNAGAEAIKGYRADEIIGRSFKAFYTEESVLSGHPDHELEIAAREGRYEEEAWRVRKDGTLFWAHVVITAVRDEHGALVGFGKVTRDLTERKRTADLLAEAERRFRRAFDDAPTGAALIDAGGVVTGANRALGVILGRPSEQLVGCAFDELFPAASTDLEGFADLVVSPRQRSWSGRELPGSGGAGWVDLHLAPLDDTAGQVRSWLVHVTDVSERRAYERRLAALADTDALTGLVNRRRFAADLTGHLARLDRSAPRGALLLLDLDGFKEVNDTLGHQAGDELLVRVAEDLRAVVRSGDVVCRLGGDEIVVLLVEAVAGEATAAAESVVRRLRARAAVAPDECRQAVTASVGVVVLGGRDSPDTTDVTADALLAEADRAMYAAKQAGRDGWAMGSPGR